MKIAKVEAIELKMPFHRGVETTGDGGTLDWGHLDFCLVRVETDGGLVGWGDAFAYNCRESVAAAIRHMVAPRVIGRDAGDIAQISYDLQQSLHLFGRYGITMFAISGLDIALWDLAAKAADMPLYRLLGGNGSRKVPAYSSLFRYGKPDLVGAMAKQSVDKGYGYVKLHEITVENVRAAREAIGEGPALMVDVNCPWTPEQALEMALAFDEFDIHWLEEPVFPPEDFASLARIRGETGVPIAAGENWCTGFQFAQALAAGAVDYTQPSVTKVGGVTEFRKVAALSEAAGVQVMPHSPYFGPGFLATLQLAGALPNPGLVERFFIRPEASLYGEWIDPVGGSFRIPDGPGLGLEPDPDVIREYRVQ